MTEIRRSAKLAVPQNKSTKGAKGAEGAEGAKGTKGTEGVEHGRQQRSGSVKGASRPSKRMGESVRAIGGSIQKAEKPIRELGEPTQKMGNPTRKIDGSVQLANRWRVNNRRKNKQQKRAVFAALDLGTNNCRLLVARQNEGGFQVIDGFSRIVRLGEGLTNSDMLDEEAILRTLEALSICADKIRYHQPKGVRLVATQACRGAKNSKQFLERVKNEIGLELEIIDQRTEAELAVASCGDLIETDVKGALMFDIGGGSTELAWLDFRGGRPKSNSKIAASIRSWHSMEIGVVTIAEKFGGKHVNRDDFENMVSFVRANLKKFKGRDKLKKMIREHHVHLIGTSGTVTTLAGLYLGLERYDRSQVDGLIMRNEQVVDTMRVLLSMPYERRAQHQCIGIDRADLVLPGCAIFEAIRREWTTDYIRIADRGLREGLLISLIEGQIKKRKKYKNRKFRNKGRYG